MFIVPDNSIVDVLPAIQMNFGFHGASAALNKITSRKENG
jgi:hypothetical protein